MGPPNIFQRIRPEKNFYRAWKWLNPEVNSSQLTESMLDVSTLTLKKETNVKLLSLLSDKEREVLSLVAEGVSTKEMADQLQLSPKTIETYRNNLINKLNARNSSDLIRIAIKEGFIRI